jgi:hypothetical protein
MQELAQQFRHIMNTISAQEATFSIISFKNNLSGTKADGVQPYSVKRTSDGEIFSIGDTVTNGMWYQGKRMAGNITGFNILDGTLFVEHTWSGVGMNLDSLYKLIGLPSEHQIDDLVWYRLWSADVSGQIKGVHFYPGKVKYDLELFGKDGDTTRIYNIDSIYVKKTI